MRLAIYFNNSRGFEILKKLKSKNKICLVVLSHKYLNKDYIYKLKKLKIKFEIIKKINQLRLYSLIKALKIDLNIVAGFPYIFNERLICSAKYGTINLHAGPIPSYRGGSPLNWQIINGEKFIRISIIKMTKKIDQGELLAKGNFKLHNNDNITTVKKKTNYLFCKIINKAINNLISNKALKQTKKNRYFKQRTAKDSRIVFNDCTAKEVLNKFRACEKPYEAFYINHNKKICIKNLKILKKDNYLKKNRGDVFKCKKNFVLVNY
jgi:methionyl-tRNA formyltransferase